MTTNVAYIEQLRRNLPPELMERPQWLVWRLVWRDSRWTKVPYNVHTEGYADTTDPATWASFEQACTAYFEGSYTGLGYVFSAEDPYTGIDFDDCIVGGELDSTRHEWLLDLDSYSEYSHSGKGVHIIVRAKLPPRGRKDTRLGVEMYDQDRFFVMTGKRVPKTPKPINERQEEIEAFHRRIFGQPDVVTANHAPAQTVDLADEKLLQVMFGNQKNGDDIRTLWEGGLLDHHASDSEGDLALCGHLSFYTGRDKERMERLFNRSRRCRDKWLQRPDYREQTLNKAIATTHNTYTHNGHRNGNGTHPPVNGHGTSPAGHRRELGITTATEKPAPPHAATGSANGSTSLTQGVRNSDGSDDTNNIVTKKSQTDLLYALATAHAEVFKGQDGEIYALVAIAGRRECYRVRSNDFAGWLTTLYREHYGRIPNATARQEVIAALSWDARHQRRDVFVRVGKHDGKVYIDLGTEAWDAIEVDAAGWRIVHTPPVAFRRPASMKPLPYPARGADLAELRKYLNIEPEHWPLVAAWLVAALNADGPYPVLVLVGQQGTAKSTTLKVLKALVDPTVAALRGQPTDIRDLMVGAGNHWLMAFDNVSQLNSDVSDALCRIATGGGYAKRALYTNDEELMIDVQRPVAINGIGDIITRSDLMDRCILLAPPLIPETKRRSERKFWRDFEEDRPKLLGALLDALSLALRQVGAVKLPTLPRMADFARLAVAAEPAFRSRIGFLNAYNANRAEANAAVVETSPIGSYLLELVSEDNVWEGTATDLLRELNEFADRPGYRGKGWPSAPNKLKPVLERLIPSLLHVGVAVAFPKRTDRKGTRCIRLSRLDAPSLETDGLSSEPSESSGEHPPV